MALISCLDGEERDVLVGLRSAKYWVHSVWFLSYGAWYYVYDRGLVLKYPELTLVTPHQKSFEVNHVPLDWGPELLCTD